MTTYVHGTPKWHGFDTADFSVDGYDRIFMYGDQTYYSISRLERVGSKSGTMGATPGRELVKWYGNIYSIPNAALRQQRFGSG